MSEREHVFRDEDPTAGVERGAPAPGRGTLTSRLAPRPQPSVVFRVESAEAAAVFAEKFGPRDGNGVAADADIAVQRAASSSGHALPDEVRGRFEASTGADLSGVRVHTGAESATAAGAVGAKAYTVGQDIHFNEGQYAPADPFGIHLLAHEVAHTVQQSGGAQRMQAKLEVSTPGDAAEAEADRAADAMVRGGVAALAVVSRRPARVKDLSKAADDGEKTMDEAMRDPQVVIMNVTNVEDKATASRLREEIQGYSQDVRAGMAAHQIEPSAEIANNECINLLSTYLASAEGQTSQINTFQGLFGMLMKDFGRLSEMMTKLDGSQLGDLKNPADAEKRGKDQAAEIFGPDDAKRETERLKKLDPVLATEMDALNVKKEKLATSGAKIQEKGNDLALALSEMSNAQRKFISAAGSIKSPDVLHEIEDAKKRARNDYTDAASKVVKDALIGGVKGVGGGPAGAAAGAGAAAAKSAWDNLVGPKVKEAIEEADIKVGVFPKDKAKADNAAADSAAWTDLQAQATAIGLKRGTIPQKVSAIGTAYTEYDADRRLYELEMIALGQKMDKLAKTSSGKLKDPCTCDPNEKPTPVKDKGPRYETAMQFMAEADRFTTQADVVKKQGDEELKVTPTGTNSASKASEALKKATTDGNRPNSFIEVKKQKGTRKDGSEFDKLTQIQHPFTLHNGLKPSEQLDGGPDETHRVGSAEGTDGRGANDVITKQLVKVDDMKTKVAAYRQSLASSIGM